MVLTPASTGRRRITQRLLKIYIYGYLNRIPVQPAPGARCQRNLEVMRLTGRWHRTERPLPISGATVALAFRNLCRRFVVLCRELESCSHSHRGHRRQRKFKAVNRRPELHSGKIDDSAGRA
jgi:hypothetical protein